MLKTRYLSALLPALSTSRHIRLSSTTMSSKPVVLITGANTGLGYETVKALYKSNTPYEILLGSRDLKKGDAAIASLKSEITSSSSSVLTVSIDVTSDESIWELRDWITDRFGKVDVLLNNAGANLEPQIYSGKMTLREAWNASWDVNISGAMMLTYEFVPLLLKSSDPRLLFVTSGTASLTESELSGTPMLDRLNASPEAGWPKIAGENLIMSYRSTKSGLNMAMREWHRMLKNDGVKVWAISPGFLATGLADVGQEQLKKMGAKDPSEGGEFIKTVVEGERDNDVGKIIRSDMIQPW